MTFRELKELLYWSMDSEPRIANPSVLAGGFDGKLINMGLRDLADCLHIVRQASMLFPNVEGVVQLPADLREILRVRYNNSHDLTPENNVHLLTNSSDVRHYLMQGLQAIQLHGRPTILTRPVEIWYLAYPAELVNDNDVPTAVPQEFREALATVYAKARVVEMLGNRQVFLNMFQQWEMIKHIIRGIIKARTQPTVYTGKWVW